MNILMLITHLGLGGAEKIFSDHAKEYAAHHNVVECYYSLDHLEPTFVTGNKTVCLDDGAPRNKIQRWVHRKRRLEELMREYKIDVCVSHMEGPNLLNTWAHAPGVRKVLVVHGTILGNTAKSQLQTKLFNGVLLPLLYKRADVIVSTSAAMHEEMLSIGLPAKKMATIVNFSDVDRIRALAKEPVGMYENLFTAHNVLLNVGRLAPQKNQQILLNVLAAMRRHGRTEKLVLVGVGEDKNSLVSKATALGLRVSDCPDGVTPDLEADVFLLGRHMNPYRFMARAALFVLSSTHEGFPLVLGEAMACGLPIVSSDCPTGPREMISSGPQTLPQKFTGVEWVDCGALLPGVGLQGLDNESAEAWVEAIVCSLEPKRRDENSRNALRKVETLRKEPLVQRWLEVVEGR